MGDIKITQRQIDDLILASTIEIVKLGEKTTVVSVTLPNDFVIIKSFSCVDSENYDHESGKKLCINRAKEKLRELEEYHLRSLLKKEF